MQFPDLFQAVDSQPLRLAVHPTFRPLPIALTCPSFLSLPWDCCGSRGYNSQLVSTRRQPGWSSVICFCLSHFHFPGYILAFCVVGNVHSIHSGYWWQKPSGYYGVALKQSGWNVIIAGSSLWLSFILVVVNDLTTRYTSGFLLPPMFTGFKVVIIKLILALSSSSVFPLAASSEHYLSMCSPGISAVLAILLHTQLNHETQQNLRPAFQGSFPGFLGCKSWWRENASWEFQAEDFLINCLLWPGVFSAPKSHGNPWQGGSTRERRVAMGWCLQITRGEDHWSSETQGQHGGADVTREETGLNPRVYRHGGKGAGFNISVDVVVVKPHECCFSMWLGVQAYLGGVTCSLPPMANPPLVYPWNHCAKLAQEVSAAARVGRRSGPKE